MRKISSFYQLQRYLNARIKESLRDNVAKASVREMQRAIKTYVYDAYTPSGNSPYIRKKYRGGLLDPRNIRTKMQKDTLHVRNVRKDRGRDVALIVEEGYPYMWSASEIYQRQPYPRRFTAVTRQRLRSGVAKQAMIDGLQQRGIDARDR